MDKNTLCETFIQNVKYCFKISKHIIMKGIDALRIIIMPTILYLQK